MIKLIIFDLDGVLVNTKKSHFDALNKALLKARNIEISLKDHFAKYDGLPTKTKLNLLLADKKIYKNDIKKIISLKNFYTNKLLNDEIKYSKQTYNLFQKLNEKGYTLCIATNAIRKTLNLCVKKLKINKFISCKFSNEDIRSPKPHPEIYIKIISETGFKPSETLVLEDSSAGRKAAQEANANLMTINDLRDVNYDNIIKKINKENLKMKKQIDLSEIWSDDQLNIVVPMAGDGSRFKEAGFTFPKPLIQVFEKPMIQIVIEQLKIKANYIFLVKEDHDKIYNISTMLKALQPNCKIIKVNKTTEGSACTVLLAKNFINNKMGLLIANSDQYVEWSPSKTMYDFMMKKVDGGIMTFESYHPKWSYAKCKENSNQVIRVAEKEVISNNATVGIYYWSKGSDFVECAEEMINKNDRVKNEFYICPVYNYALKKNKIIIISEVEKMHGLGTPEDLNNFLNLKIL